MFIKKLHLGHYSILSFQGSCNGYGNFHQKLFFLFSKIYSKNCIRDNMVWPILSFQGSYMNVHLTLTYFLVLKIYWKIVSGTAWFGCYFPFQGFYQVFVKGWCFFSVSSLHRHGLTYIIHLENNDQFLSKAHIANSDQDKIYGLKHIVLSSILHIFPSKALFCYLKYFWNFFSQGQYEWIHNVHLENFGQSLSKSYSVIYDEFYYKVSSKTHAIFYFKCV